MARSRPPAPRRNRQGRQADLHRANAAAAKESLDAFDAEWGHRYPAAIALWRNAWEEFIPFLDYNTEIMKRYLAYLTGIEPSPNTVKAYAHDLKDWFESLVDRGLDWRSATLEDVGGFVAWLRAPAEARDGRVTVLPSAAPVCSESTVNRKLSALGSFYTHAARDGVDVARLLSSWQVGGARGRWKPFLHHISRSVPQRRRTVALKDPTKLRRVLTPEQVQALLDGCKHLPDRLLLVILYDTGMRIGEALGLRHSDIAAAERQITVMRCDNDNRARAKSLTTRTVPVSAELTRL
jgi:integrase/recombinase XerD